MEFNRHIKPYPNSRHLHGCMAQGQEWGPGGERGRYSEDGEEGENSD